MEICLLVFLAGALQSAMSSFNGVLQGYVGQFGVSLITHVVGGSLLILYILIKRRKIKLGPMPWYLYSAGLFGLIQVAGTSLCVLKIGPAYTTCLSICGQLIQSILVDHFGLLGARRVPFDRKRIPALVVILAGILIVNFSGQGTTSAGPAGYLLLAFLVGSVGVFSKMVNFHATEHLGTANGTLINYLVASLLSGLLLVCTGTGETWAGFGQAPAWVYLGGVCGVVALVIIVTSLKKLSLFQSNTFLLVGQLAGSSLLDAVLFNSMSPGKLAGVLVVTIGVVWDKKNTLAQ